MIAFASRRGLRRGIVVVAVCAAPSAFAVPASAAGLVSRFDVTTRVKPILVGGTPALEVREVRISGIHGHLHAGCNKCRRLAGHLRRTRSERTLTITNANWIITARRSVLISVTKPGRVGRFVRLGIVKSHPERLVFRDSGCMTLALRQRRCPKGSASPVVGSQVPQVADGAAPTSPAPVTGTSTTTPRPSTTTPPTTTVAVPPPVVPRVDRTAPSDPGGLSASSPSQNSITLSWQASSDPSGIARYTVYLNGGAVATTTGTSYTFGDLACGTGYTVGVLATDNADNNSARPQIGAGTQACPPPPTWGETAGGVAHTWTNYTNAGGSEGPTVGSGWTIQISCKLSGFRVADGNTWWYRIAQSPWNDSYFVSADAFYNNGATSGSLHGTPFVDAAVRDC
jgi:hypothetical protein